MFVSFSPVSCPSHFRVLGSVRTRRKAEFALSARLIGERRPARTPTAGRASTPPQGARPGVYCAKATTRQCRPERGEDDPDGDPMLPGIDGFEGRRRLRRSGVGSATLTLAREKAIDDRSAGLDSCADDYLPKQFSVAELFHRLGARGRVKRPLTSHACSSRSTRESPRQAWRVACSGWAARSKRGSRRPRARSPAPRAVPLSRRGPAASRERCCHTPR